MEEMHRAGGEELQCPVWMYLDVLTNPEAQETIS